MLSIGTCRVCGTGPLGLRRCGVCRRVVVLCDECDTAWRGDRLSEPGVVAHEAEMPCPQCRASLWVGGASWATRAEADASDWVADGGFTLEEGAPLDPGP